MPQISPKYRKDYRSQNYRNLLIARDKEKTKKRAFAIVFSVSLAILIGLGYFLFFSPVFKIKNIKINGLEKIKKENIEQIINKYLEKNKMVIFSRKNFWIFNKDELRGLIFERYYFDSFEIKKKLPSSVIINLKEKQAVVNWLTNNLCFHLDPSALVVEFCEENNGFVTIKNLLDEPLKVGDYAIESWELKQIIELFNAIKTSIRSQLQLTQIEKDGDLLNFNTVEGVILKFNMLLSNGEQLSRLNVLINQDDIKNNLTKLEYIDLRFGEKIYYK